MYRLISTEYFALLGHVFWSKNSVIKILAACYMHKVHEVKVYMVQSVRLPEYFIGEITDSISTKFSIAGRLLQQL